MLVYYVGAWLLFNRGDPKVYLNICQIIIESLYLIHIKNNGSQYHKVDHKIFFEGSTDILINEADSIEEKNK